jgi:hypothetical protein
MSNLRLINETSGTSVSTLNVTDVFNSDFDIYKIVINNLDQSAQNYIEARAINSSGSVVSTSNYEFASLELASNTSFAEKKGTSKTKWETSISYQNTGADDGVGITMYVFNPYDSSSYTFVISQSFAYYSSGGLGYKMIGVLKQQSNIGGIQFFARSGTLDNITVKTYGLRIDS